MLQAVMAHELDWMIASTVRATLVQDFCRERAAKLATMCLVTAEAFDSVLRFNFVTEEPRRAQLLNVGRELWILTNESTDVSAGVL